MHNVLRNLCADFSVGRRYGQFGHLCFSVKLFREQRGGFRFIHNLTQINIHMPYAMGENMFNLFAVFIKPDGKAVVLIKGLFKADGGFHLILNKTVEIFQKPFFIFDEKIFIVFF